MPTNKAPFRFHLEEADLLKIKYIAKDDNRSASNLLEFLCKKCIKAYEEENGEIEVELGEE